MGSDPDGAPRYRSRFGGLWPDRLDAPELLRTCLARGELRGEAGRWLGQWIEQGFAVLERAVPEPVIDAFNAAVDRVWESGDPLLYVDYFENGQRFTIPAEPRHRAMNIKLIDLYPQLPEARAVMFAPALLRFLGLVFERQPMAFQSLYFRLGSMQSMHQDTAYVAVEPPMEFVGCWVALEDIQEGSGELEYYAGSHRLPEFLWDGQHKLMPPDHPDHARYLASRHEEAARLGLERIRFRPRKGDALFWNADLVHGGAPEIRPGLTRRSLVSHYCPVDRGPAYLGVARSSPKLRDPSGGWYCYVYRWPKELDRPPAPAPEPSATSAPRRSWGARLRGLFGRRDPGAGRAAPGP